MTKLEYTLANLTPPSVKEAFRRHGPENKKISDDLQPIEGNTLKRAAGP